MTQYNILASSDEATVVTEYLPDTNTSAAYQSEAALEKEFIDLLGRQGYQYVTIHSEKDLVDNLRKQLEKLNNYSFSDSEWKRFFSDMITSAS